MDIEFYGANCLVFSNKKTRVVVDDNLADLRAKPVSKDGDIAVYTGPHGLPAAKAQLVLDHPGEYEVSDASVYGIATRSHMDEAGQHDATMFKIIIGDFRILVTGHIYPELNERQLETIGIVDVMCVPVGGNGYTTDPIGAQKLIKMISPKMVVPTHYDEKGLNYPVPQQSLTQALHDLAMEPAQTVDKLRLKAGDLSEFTQLVVLKRS